MSGDKIKTEHPQVDFILKKEVFFVVIGSMMGAFIMFIPRIILDFTVDTQYYVIWLVFSSVVNANSFEIGALIHFLVATVIGIVTGLVLYKGKFLNISKISHAFVYGIIAGTVVFAAFFIPVNFYILGPNYAQVISELDPSMTIIDAEQVIEENLASTLIDSLITHLIWGISLSLISSGLTRKMGSNYRCKICDIQFSKISTFEKHHKIVHKEPNFSPKRILILGGGFGGIQVLNDIQNKLHDEVGIEISLVSEDNFFLFTPMLPEMSTGMIEPRHIATPVRTFCRRARFYEAAVESIDLDSKTVTIKRTYDNQIKNLGYDYLVIALGSRNNFFGNKGIEKNALTIKTLGDAIGIRNHLITMLENADQEENAEKRSKFLTFVVVGGGFSGVETVGEINDFVREAIDNYYRTLSPDQLKVILVAAGDGILPEVGEELGRFAFESLVKDGVTIIPKTKVISATEDTVTLSNQQTIHTNTFVWAGGIAMDPVIESLICDHDSRGRVIVDDYLHLSNHQEVFVLGDCASITDKTSKKPYPPTAQHSKREAKIVANNLVQSFYNSSNLKTFHYKTRGTMAKIGKRNGVGILLGNKIKGFTAWLVWRQYYLANLPTNEKKIRVALDWFIALFFKPDITRFRNMKDQSFER